MSTPKGPPPKLPPKGGPPARLAPGQGEVDPAWRERMLAALDDGDAGDAGDASAPPVAQAPRVITEGRAVALPESVPDQGALPMVGELAGIEAHDGARVRVRGRYVSVDVRRAALPPPVHRGHAAIELADGRRVYLFPTWRDESRRPLDEATRLEGRAVVAVGTIWRRAPEDPEGGASLIDPCLDPVEAIAPD